MPSKLVKYFGTDDPPAQTRLLKAGSMTVELDAGNLRYVRYNGHEAIRAVSYVVRDQYWGTFNPTIENFRLEETGDSFTVTYEALCSDGQQQFKYEVRIVGKADGSLKFEGMGTALTDFLTNRTGFVVLHPVEGVSGFPVTVEQVDGRKIETRFPEVIDPKQPIMDIRALTHQVTPGLEAICTMTGDTFEMEDQRNWTDASYKTYVRPLGLPFPYTLRASETIKQAVEVRFIGEPAVIAGGEKGTIEVHVGEPRGRLPRFGMALEAQDVDIARTLAQPLAALEPKFLSGYLDMRKHDCEIALEGFKAVAELVGAELSLEIVVADETDPADTLQQVARAAKAAGVGLATVAVTWAGDLDFVMPGTLFPDSSPFDRLYAAGRAAFPEVPLGGGSFAYFTELNRKPPPFDRLDFVCHTTCALVHAADDRSVAETIECLPYIVKSGRALFHDKRYRIGPATIGTRTSPFGNEPTPNADNVRVTMTRQDPRQRGLLGAAWHLGYAARMAAGGVDEVILGAAAGDYGLIHHATDLPQPWYDDAGGVFPSYHVMRSLYAASGAVRRDVEISAPREVQGLCFETDRGLHFWVANLAGEERMIAVGGLDSGQAQMTVLDEDNFEACTSDPGSFEATERPVKDGQLVLAPYAVVRLRLPD